MPFFKAIRGVFLLAICLVATHTVEAQNLCALASDEIQNVFYIPQIGHGTDTLGNRVDTKIRILNFQGVETVTATVVSCGDAGELALLRSDLGESTAQVDITLEPGGTAAIQSLNNDPDNELAVGYAGIITSDSLGISVLFNIVDAQGNLTSTDVRPAPLVTRASFFVEAGDGVNTGVAILLPPNALDSSEVGLRVRDSDGTINDKSCFTMEPGDRISKFVTEIVPGLASLEVLGGGLTLSGAIEVYSNVPVALMPLRQEGIVITTESVFPPRLDVSAVCP